MVLGHQDTHQGRRRRRKEGRKEGRVEPGGDSHAAETGGGPEPLGYPMLST